MRPSIESPGSGDVTSRYSFPNLPSPVVIRKTLSRPVDRSFALIVSTTSTTGTARTRLTASHHLTRCDGERRRLVRELFGNVGTLRHRSYDAKADEPRRNVRVKPDSVAGSQFSG